MADHEIWLTTPTGTRITNLSDNLGGYFARVSNKRAPCMVRLPGNFKWRELLAPDRMIQFWRQPLGRSMSLFRSYFIGAWEPATDVEGNTVITVWGYDANDLLYRRIVAAYQGESESTATDEEADDLMKRIAIDMLSDAIAPTPDAGTRALSLLTVQGDQTKGPQLTRSFEWDKVIEELVEIAQASKTEGNEVFFDIVESNVTTNSIAFEFRTKTGQPGQNVSDRVVFSQENKSLTVPRLLIDYRDSVNYAYGVGQGDGTDAEVQQVSDAKLYGASIWARREGYAYAGGEEEGNGVREAARALVAEGRPDRTFSAKTVDRDGTRLGRDYGWGDKVRAKAFGLEFDCILRKTVIFIDQDAKERIDQRLEFED